MGRLAEYRRQYDAVISRLIDRVENDPAFDQRDDILALLLRSTYEDGSPMSRKDIGDELLTLLAAGHETTASTLGWAFERISRHPEVLAQLVAEAATDGNEYRQATILEVQRARTVIDFAGRHVYAPSFRLGDWDIPRGYSIVVAISQIQERADEFPDPERFDPQRFIGSRPGLGWIPFGGGTRRCVGAAFANVEMDVVLRTVLRHFVIETTSAPGRRCIPAAWPIRPRPAGASSCGDARRRWPDATGWRSAAWAASSPGAGSGTCTRSGSAPDSPGVRARPPRNRPPGSPR